MIKTEALRRRERRQALLTVVFTIISVIYLMPVLLVLINSLKANAFVKKAMAATRKRALEFMKHSVDESIRKIMEK